MRKRFTAVALALGLRFQHRHLQRLSDRPKLSDNPEPGRRSRTTPPCWFPAETFAFQSEGHLTRTVCISMQQCAGTTKRYLSLGQYVIGDDDFYTDWSDTYIRGGLLDLRRMRRARSARRRTRRTPAWPTS